MTDHARDRIPSSDIDFLKQITPCEAIKKEIIFALDIRIKKKRLKATETENDDESGKSSFSSETKSHKHLDNI